MKYIKSFNEVNEGLFGFFRKKNVEDSEEDKIILKFIQRLEKVKDVNPYQIIKFDELHDDAGDSKAYKVIFDDVVITTGYIKWKYATRYNNYNKNDYRFYTDVDGEKDAIDCQDKYRKALYDIVDKIYNDNLRKKKIDRVNREINPAADLL